MSEKNGESMDFGEALSMLKGGACVQRLGWNGRNMHIYLVDGEALPSGDVEYEPCIVMFTAQGTHQPGWLASQADMLAEDWQEAP